MSSFLKTKKWEEMRHLIGGIILLLLIFLGYSIPTIVTLLLMLIVSWMAIISFTGFRTAVIVSGGSFLVRFLLLAFQHGKLLGGESSGLLDDIEASMQTCVLVSMIFGAVIWVRKILRSKRAGFDEVLGAVNLYIWIAIIYACLYTLISRSNPASFHLDIQLTGGSDALQVKRDFNELFYFSFITQTTLGYGDIVPVGHLARSLAISQAIIGQFYVAVVLTYILNLWIRDLGKHVDPNGDQPVSKVSRGKGG
ncbi:MAG: potassium channel family protein [Chthoniobacterales bacterium]